MNTDTLLPCPICSGPAQVPTGDECVAEWSARVPAPTEPPDPTCSVWSTLKITPTNKPTFCATAKAALQKHFKTHPVIDAIWRVVIRDEVSGKRVTCFIKVGDGSGPLQNLIDAPNPFTPTQS